MRPLVLVGLVAMLVACGGAAPTPTPVPTATPVPITAGAVVERLKTAGLPIGEIVAYTAESDPNKLLGRPNQYTGKANFHDTRLPATPDMSTSGGGSVEIFATEADTQARKTYVEGLGKQMPALVEYDYLAGRVLLRLSRALSPEQARQYEQALAAATK